MGLFDTEPQDSGGAMSLATDFEEFWKCYPRKVGKLDAKKAYERARKTQGATQEELLDGIRRYITSKPEYADYCHPATWLRGGRWMDEPGTQQATRQPERPFTATELSQANDWYRRIGTSLDRDVPRHEHIARFIRKQRLQVAS